MRGDCNAVRGEEAGHMKYGESLLVTSWDTESYEFGVRQH